MKNIRILFFICLLCGGLSSCKKIDPLFGKEYNSERLNLGMPTIPDEWSLSGVSEYDASWSNPEIDTLLKMNMPFHASKYVDYHSGVLQYEMDKYYGIEDFTWDGSSFREVIYITHFYSS